MDIITSIEDSNPMQQSTIGKSFPKVFATIETAIFRFLFVISLYISKLVLIVFLPPMT